MRNGNSHFVNELAFPFYPYLLYEFKASLFVYKTAETPVERMSGEPLKAHEITRGCGDDEDVKYPKDKLTKDGDCGGLNII